MADDKKKQDSEMNQDQNSDTRSKGGQASYGSDQNRSSDRKEQGGKSQNEDLSDMSQQGFEEGSDESAFGDQSSQAKSE